MAVIDQSGGNENARFSAGPADRPVKAYQWVCTNPGCPSPAQIGRIEDGCVACGAGADAKAGTPLTPTDFNCQACKGSGTVERKCAACNGTGMLDAPTLGEPPPTCDKCGGAGALALGCGRCDGSGIDPTPAPKPVALPEEPPLAPPVVPPAPKPPAMPAPQAGIFKPGAAAALPTLEEAVTALTSPGTVVRYRLIRYEGPAEDIERTMSRSLSGGRRWPNGNTIAAVEIAQPSSTPLRTRLEALADAADGEWPNKDSF